MEIALTDTQSDEALTSWIAANRQVITHCEDEIRYIEGVLKARKVRPELPEGFVPYDPANPPVCGEGDRIEMMYQNGHITVGAARLFLAEWDKRDLYPHGKRTAYRVIKSTPALKLQVGKTYARADGEERTIDFYNNGGIRQLFQDNGGAWYTPEGGYFYDNRECLMNLVREVVRETSAEVIDRLAEVLATQPYTLLDGTNTVRVNEAQKGQYKSLLTRAIELKIKEVG